MSPVARLLACLLPALLAHAALRAQATVSIPCAADNTLYEDLSGGISNGAGVGVFVGNNAFGRIRRAVLRFDVAAALPPGSRVLAAQIALTASQSTVGAALTVTGHRVLASWGEGTSVAGSGGGGGAPSTTGDATWAHGFFPTQPWAAPGGDFATTPSFTAAMPPLGAFTTDLSAQAAADVQDWLAQPASNHGWLLKLADEVPFSTAHRINSREAASGNPVLLVTYLGPGATGTWGTGCPSGLIGQVATAAWTTPPVGGTTLTITKSQTISNSVGVDLFSLALDPVGTLLAPGCRLYLPLAFSITGNTFFTDVSGAGSSTLFLPAGYPGYLLHCQSAVLAGTPLGFVLTNSALAVTQ